MPSHQEQDDLVNTLYDIFNRHCDATHRLRHGVASATTHTHIRGAHAARGIRPARADFRVRRTHAIDADRASLTEQLPQFQKQAVP
jgi:hypothetical protein